MTDTYIWGFTVQKSASGKNIWPNELKWEATRRIREEGQSPGDVAAELGAHECLVRKWSVADRRRRGEKIRVEGPAFAALEIQDEPAHVEGPAYVSKQPEFGRILCRGTSIEFPLGIAECDLLKLVRVAGQLQ